MPSNYTQNNTKNNIANNVYDIEDCLELLTAKKTTAKLLLPTKKWWQKYGNGFRKWF